jgi:ethanolamine ammonia-lyase large subunit
MDRKELLEILRKATKKGTTCKAAQKRLCSLLVAEIDREPLVVDDVGRVLAKYRKSDIFEKIRNFTIGEIKTILLSVDGMKFAQLCQGALSSEIISVLAKVMTNEELGTVSRKLYNTVSSGGVTVGSRSHFGSEIQVVADKDSTAVLFSVLECLGYGCGDVVIGITPSQGVLNEVISLQKTLASIVRNLNLPTRWCVFSESIETQQQVRKSVSDTDLFFLRIAGTSKELLQKTGYDIEELLLFAKTTNGFYLKTDPASATQNGDIDTGTLQSRAFGVARFLQQNGVPVYVSQDVIFSEGISCENESSRICLENIFMAKLHGLIFGISFSTPFCFGVSLSRLRQLSEKIINESSPAFTGVVSGSIDLSIPGLTISPRDHAKIRTKRGVKITTAMQQSLISLGVLGRSGLPKATPEITQGLYCVFREIADNSLDKSELEIEAGKKVAMLQQQNLDIGYGCPAKFITPPLMEERVRKISQEYSCPIQIPLKWKKKESFLQRFIRVVKERFHRLFLFEV